MPWSEKQKDFFANSYRSFNIACGSVSSGKTTITNFRWYKHIYDAPRGSILIMSGKTLEALYDNSIRYLKEMDLGNDMELSTPRKGICTRAYVKSNGVDIVCIGANDEASWQRGQGKTTAGWYADEITNQPRSLVKSLQKSCRHEGKPWPKFWTCNPDLPGHYIKTEYLDPIEVGELNGKTWSFSMDDNPALTDEYKNELRKTYTGIYYDRFILGKWVSAEGVIFTEFVRGKHTLPRAEIERLRPQFTNIRAGLDFGYAHPMGVVLIGEIDGTYFLYREMKVSRQTIDFAFVNTTLKDFLLGETEDIYGDTARPDLVRQLDDLVRDYGVRVLTTSKTHGSVLAGINLINSYFKAGRLFVAEDLKETISELESYRWKLDHEGKVRAEEPLKIDDDLIDAMRYAFDREVQGISGPGKIVVLRGLN